MRNYSFSLSTVTLNLDRLLAFQITYRCTERYVCVVFIGHLANVIKNFKSKLK